MNKFIWSLIFMMAISITTILVFLLILQMGMGLWDTKTLVATAASVMLTAYWSYRMPNLPPDYPDAKQNAFEETHLT